MLDDATQQPDPLRPVYECPPAALSPLLRAHRTRAGLSQARLAQRMGLNPSYINRLELEERHPSRAVVLSLINVLDLTEAEGDRLLYAAGLAPATDWQRAYEILVSRVRAARPSRPGRLVPR